MTNFTPTTNLSANKAIVIDTTSPTISETTPITTPTADTTPDYTFASNEAGTIIYYGESCDSADTIAISGSNTVTLDALANGTYTDCTITVTDTAGNISNILTITSFTILSAGITITESASSTDIEEGSTIDTYTIVLDTTPTNDVVITITPDTQSTTDFSTLTFTSANWNTPQTITVTATDDTDIEGDHTSTIVHSSASVDTNYDGISISSVTANITDNDFAGGGMPSGFSNLPTPPSPTANNPEGGFRVIINNNKTTNSNTVTLKLFAGHDTTGMAISNREDFKNASIVPYQEEIEWDLGDCNTPRPLCVHPSQEGNVYAKFYTRYGVSSETVSISITSDHNSLQDGDLIQNPNAEGMEQFDVYIIKIIDNKKYKRLILTPQIFESYSHFDKNKDNNPWNDIITTDEQTIDIFTISNLVRCQDEKNNINDSKVYQLEPNNDTGIKRHLNLTVEQFTSEGYDWDEVFIINKKERDWYEMGEEIR